MPGAPSVTVVGGERDDSRELLDAVRRVDPDAATLTVDTLSTGPTVDQSERSAASGDTESGVGGDPSEGPPACGDVDDGGALEAADAVLTVGAAAFRSVAVLDPDAPLVPIGPGAGVRSLPAEDVESGLQSVLEGAPDRERHPVLAVSVDGTRVGTAVHDCSLCTGAPARISEYRIETPQRSPLARVRADGVVVATPAGSSGYANRIGAPSVAPGAGLAVAPIAAFQTAGDAWVVPEGRVDLAIRRGAVPTAVRIDGIERTRIPGTDTVTVEPDHWVDVLVAPESEASGAP